MLRSAEIEVKIWHMPVEIPNPIPFDQDHVHASYDPACCGEVLAHLVVCGCGFQPVPVGISSGSAARCTSFWGSFDLAASRFSGRRAPERPGADAMTREAYSHEVSSVGFWPGSGDIKDAAFYSYTVPEPQGI